MSSLSVPDRWHRFWYLQEVGMWLDPMPGRRRRAVLRELGANLEAAAADVGMTAAISDLGRPRALARQYLEQEPTGRPLWSTGALAAAVVVSLWLLATMTYTFGMLDGMQGADVSGRVESSFLGLRVVAETGPEQLGATFSGIAWPALAAALLVFALAARLWRLVVKETAAA